MTAARSFDSPYTRTYVLYAMGVLFLVSVFNVIDRFILSILAPAIQDDLSLSDTQMGLLLGPSFSTVHFLAVLPAAWLADRTARRSVIAAGLFVWSAMTALGGLAQNFAQIFLARMGVGIGEAAGSPPAAGLLVDTAPEAWRTRALSTITIGALAGVAAGMIVGGIVSQHFGWRVALLAVGVPGVGLSLLVRFTLREPPRAAIVAVPPWTAARHLFAFRSFTWTVGAACLTSIAATGRSLWEPAFLHRIYGLSLAEVGIVYVLIGALPAALGAFVGSGLADRLSASDRRWLAWVCTVGNLVAFPCLTAFLLWPESHVVTLGARAIPVSYGFSLVGSFFIGFFSPPTAAIAQSLATPRMRSLAHAIWSMASTLIGMGVGPFAVGFLSEAWRSALGDQSLRYGLVAVTAVLPLSAIGYAVAARHLPGDIERRDASAS